MKTLYFYLTFITLLIFSSCVKEPFADFIASDITVSPGEVIYFTNRSYDAESFEWDFGDGYYSTNYNVSHFYDDPGMYNVTLTAFGKNNTTNRSVMRIDVLSTDLLITVREWFDEYTVENASVILYTSLEDWDNFTNPLVEGFTDNNGEVLFTDLNPGVKYYVDVYEANHDNYTLAADDISWIITNRLVFGQINYFTAWVDYYDSKKSVFERKDLRNYILNSHKPDETRRIDKVDDKK